MGMQQRARDELAQLMAEAAAKRRKSSFEQLVEGVHAHEARRRPCNQGGAKKKKEYVMDDNLMTWRTVLMMRFIIFLECNQVVEMEEPTASRCQ